MNAARSYSSYALPRRFDKQKQPVGTHRHQPAQRVEPAYVKGTGARISETFLVYNVADALSLSPCLAASLVPDVNADSLRAAEGKLERLLHTLQLSPPR